MMDRKEQDWVEDEESRASRKLFSRVLVILLFLWIAGFGLVALYQSLQPRNELRTVVSPFKPWEGEWTGEIVVTHPSGEVVRRVSQTRRYRHVLTEEDFRQEGHFTETGPDGTIEIERQMNSMDFKFLTLRRKTIRKNGAQSVDYAGSLEDGAIVWTHHVPTATLTLREWVEGDMMFIEGEERIGIPPDAKVFTIRGKFQRMKPVDEAGADADNAPTSANEPESQDSEVKP